MFTVLLFLGIFLLGFYLSFIYMQNAEVCQTHQNPESQKMDAKLSKDNNFLVVIIFSAPENFEKRVVIRKTWLLTKNNLDIRHFFVIGLKSLNSKKVNALKSEHFEFVDLLLLENVSDSFSGLSNKLLETLKWLDKHIKYTFVLKVDDDSFVRLDALHAKMLMQPKEKLYWGFFDGRAHVKRSGKWAEKTWFLCDRYLPYALGGGYVVTQDLVEKIVMMSDFLSLYQNEDVALGTWLSPFEIKRLHDPQFDTEYLSRGCDNSYLVTHKQSTTMMVSKYNHIVKSGKMCLSEYKSRNSYIYNWAVPPSLCCDRNNSRIP